MHKLAPYFFAFLLTLVVPHSIRAYTGNPCDGILWLLCLISFVWLVRG